jgi:hypothetical protein
VIHLYSFTYYLRRHTAYKLTHTHTLSLSTFSIIIFGKIEKSRKKERRREGREVGEIFFVGIGLCS